MNRVWRVNVVLSSDMVRIGPQVFNVVADNDIDARVLGINLAKSNWYNLYGKKHMPSIKYCEITLEMILSDQVYDSNGIIEGDGG
jgi:hypothetical protein